MGNNTQTRNLLAILFGLLSVFLFANGAFAQNASDYPLDGQEYSACVWSGDECVDDQGARYYDAKWEGYRLWQWRLREVDGEKKAHGVGFTIEEGTYEFNGISCALYIDPARNGNGATDENFVIEEVNDYEFTVDTEDDGQAWGLVECEPGAASGFDMWALDYEKIHSEPDSADDDATPEADRMSLDDEPEEVFNVGNCDEVNEAGNALLYRESIDKSACTYDDPAEEVFNVGNCDEVNEAGNALLYRESIDKSACTYDDPATGTTGTTGTTGGTGGVAAPNFFQRIWNFIIGSGTFILVLAVLALIWWIIVLIRAFRRNWVVGIGLLILGVVLTPIVAAIIGEITLWRAKPSFWAWRPGTSATTTTTTAS